MNTEAVNLEEDDALTDDEIEQSKVEQPKPELEEAETVEEADDVEPDEGEGDQEVDTLPADEEKPKVTFTDEQQEIFNRELARVKYEERRKLQEQMQRQQEASNDVEPTIPPLPTDEFEDGYADKVKAHYEAKAKHDAYIATKQSQQMAKAQQAETKFVDDAKRSGITDQQIGEAVLKVREYGGIGEISFDLMQMDGAAEITMALADDPLKVEYVRSLSPLQAGAYLAGLRSKPKPEKKRTAAPKPPKSVTGGRASKPESPYLKGATFE